MSVKFLVYSRSLEQLTFETIGPFSVLFVKIRPKLGRRFIPAAYVSSSRLLRVLRPNNRPVGNIGHAKSKSIVPPMSVIFLVSS
jgi:hypothetical protein